MMFNVPQFIDVEDKIAGPLTWRQIFWMIGMGAALLTFYNVFDRALFFVIAVPTILLFVLFAFYRPNGVSMATFTLYTVLYIFQPKVAVWERPALEKARPEAKADQSKTIAPAPVHSELDAGKLRDLAKILDTK